MKKMLGILLIVLTVTLSGCGFSDVANISNYTADITFNTEGDMTVHETWNMNYYEDLRVRFRDIDYQKYPEDYPLEETPFNQAVFDETSVEVSVLKDGIDITNEVGIGYSFNDDMDELNELVRCEPYRYSCESIFVDTMAKGNLSGNMVFSYTYTIEGVITEYSDISEANWVLFEYAEGSIDQGVINITLPPNYYSVDKYHLWSTGVKDSKEEILSSNTMKISFSNMKSSDYIGFRLLAPTDLFPDIAFKNIFITDEMNEDVLVNFHQEIETQEQISNTAGLVYLCVVIAAVIVVALLYRRYYKKYLAPIKVKFDNNKIYSSPPSNHTPGEIAYLCRNKVINDSDITATLLDLVARGYLNVSEQDAFEKEDEKAIRFTLNKERNLEDLKDHERYLIKSYIEIFGDGNSVSFQEIEDYIAVDDSHANKYLKISRMFEQLLIRIASANDFYDRSYRENKAKLRNYLYVNFALLIIGIVLYIALTPDEFVAIAILLISSAVFYLFTFGGSRFSENGVALSQKWNSYRNYIDETMQAQDLDFNDVEFWEDKLIYATTFDLTNRIKSVIKTNIDLRVQNFPEDATMQISDSEKLSYFYRFNRRALFFNRAHSSIESKAHDKVYKATIISSGGRSGFSGGGGFGGGGGGGGRSR